MRKAAYVIALLGMVLFLDGCALVRLARFAHGQKVLTIDPNEITFCGAQADGLHFDVALQLENLTPVEAHLQEIHLEALLRGATVFSATTRERLSVPGKGTLTVHVPVAVDPLGAAVSAAGGARTLVFRGTVKADMGVLGERGFSFESSQRLFPGTRPRMRLEGISVGKSTLRELHLTLRMSREDDGDDPYRSVSIAGTVLINGRKVGVIDFRQTEDLSNIFEIDVAVSTARAAWVTAQVVRAKKLDLRVEALLEAESDAWKFRIPYVFERKDITIGRDKPSPPDARTETETRFAETGVVGRSSPQAPRALRTRVALPRTAPVSVDGSEGR